jgi:O-antigen chain-terminating methyltransferase
VPGDEATPDREAEEVTAVIRAIRERVRARHPDGAAGPFEVALPDLMPLVHARDAAETKVASIGSVNPRPPGALNSLLQRIKNLIARSLDWHVRDQVEFNRGAMACVDATLTALDETKYALVSLSSEFANRIESRLAAELGALATQLREESDRQFDHLRRESEALRASVEEQQRQLDIVRADSSQLLEEARQLQDVRKHWAEWRVEWERKLSVNEIQFLRSAADLQTGFQHRASLMEANFREIAKSQHVDFEGALNRSIVDIQQRLWADLEKMRLDYEQIIHSELRAVRQRASIAPAAGAAAAIPPAAALTIDYLHFANKFRGPEEKVKERQKFYVEYFKDCREVLDIGCGRGEFLELMREAGVPARGIELGQESVALCRAKGLEAEAADAFVYLAGLADCSVHGIFCAHVIEHLPPERLPEFIRLIAGKLRHHGIVAIETPNPECLASLSTHFYVDPTHTRPVPPALLTFYEMEAGLGGIELLGLSPATAAWPVLEELPAAFRDAFFGSLDYAIIARKLS